jgi:hypothetical protein
MSMIGQGDGIAFDGNAAFPFNIHIVQNLILKISFITDAGKLNQAVGKCGFTVVNMSDDTKVSDVFHNSLFTDTISISKDNKPTTQPTKLAKESEIGMKMKKPS